MPDVLIRTAYDGLAAEVSNSSGVDFTVKKDSKGKVTNPEVLSKTVQSEKDSCDINLIVASAQKNGGLIMGALGTPISGDFSNLGDWLYIKNKVAIAERSFALLPADVRNKFDNDVKKLYDFLADSKNDKEAVELRLKPFDVLLTALADDGKTRITQEERDSLDKKKAAPKGAAGASGTDSGS